MAIPQAFSCRRSHRRWRDADPEIVGGETGPMHSEIMDELRAIRAQMGRARVP